MKKIKNLKYYYMENNSLCQGPCLPHCSTASSVKLLVISFGLGVLFGIIMFYLVKYFNEKNKKSKV
jgi:hypothetical protein